ncbi:phosphonate ABC transporter, permease protein PhnE [Mesorhizobium sp.]|uniref:phosphonate ABC transporter, permease protein PhnE n=1 Tax=Mesorhizobium sp. TaxID=1871066 RepID=UPI000FE50871|nr:MAG: phosphonate ABC transporter, permease protein PhnE [Mesorhizobium sp.]RWK70366.1 MAG: phosphonate ABC transporter, permease protein PhnE [Mesorhizobium sp.]RWK80628.1 MAG: phosphonate ABC transporter, permease protein PhnE [Mesorhizobium sp.]RWK83184.1 MAG: phosphonate ABC transporter, permease protein PhnE [Mesorhizobium sp.]RWL09086.1 MAG: phosphonate ABC transporter, permease protein PhnE [Mesorhizobium sp.]
MHDRLSPSRIPSISPLTFSFAVALAALVIVSAGQVAPSPEQLAGGAPKMAHLVGRMIPPNVEPGFLLRVFWRMVETFQIALVGTAIGVALSLPFAWLSAKHITPLGPFRHVSRMLVSLFRTVPDLVWALVFVSAVGLGAVAGTMTIVVDTIGFCGRFFAEAMEDADERPQEALFAIGASRFSVLCGAVLPDAMPSLINTTLFALEKAVRSSVVLGLVGAGGIGQELKVAFDLFQYKNASTIILVIFAIVVLMEFVTDRLRSKVQ